MEKIWRQKMIKIFLKWEENSELKGAGRKGKGRGWKRKRKENMNMYFVHAAISHYIIIFMYYKHILILKLVTLVSSPFPNEATLTVSGDELMYQSFPEPPLYIRWMNIFYIYFISKLERTVILIRIIITFIGISAYTLSLNHLL